jgi:hypothetical protein
MITAFKKPIAFMLILASIGLVNAQSIDGELLLNGKKSALIELETNSVTDLFKAFKTREHELSFRFKSNDTPKYLYGESIVFFDFITQVKKDGKLIKEVRRDQPFPYFPGDMFLAPECFDFIPVLASIEKEEGPLRGTLPAGKYSVILKAVPRDAKGSIETLEIYFALRKRPTR